MPYGEKLRRSARYHYLRILRQRTSSHGLATGLATGVFSAFLPYLPFVPLHSIVAVALAFILRGSKAVALATSVLISPVVPFTCWWLQLKIGQMIWPMPGCNLSDLSLEKLMAVGCKGLLLLTIGGVVLGAPLAVATYAFARPAIESYRKRRAIRLLRQRTSR